MTKSDKEKPTHPQTNYLEITKTIKVTSSLLEKMAALRSKIPTANIPNLTGSLLEKINQHDIISNQLLAHQNLFKNNPLSIISSTYPPLHITSPLLAQTLKSMEERNPFFYNSEFLKKLEKYNTTLSELLEDFPSKSKALSKIGWFFHPKMGVRSLPYLVRSINAIKIEGEDFELLVNKVFSAHFENKFDNYANQLIHNFPDRENILNPAFEAHKNRVYSLSVLAFLSQADGIVAEKGYELFQKKTSITQKAAEEREKLLANENWHWTAKFIDGLWAPMSEKLAIAYNEGERKKENYTGLNRNTILHGYDKDYGNELNSLKAFSLLCAVSFIWDE
ncbi:hypothetical protein ABH313_24145 [Chromobacterium vaccinii]|uniref:hypothetical protein n=1 Tax=Chromobacterium vaccinii TaxID=1108595 RepID=UPI00326050D1